MRIHTKLRELSKVVYSPMKPMLEKYADTEKNKLLADLEASTSAKKDILDELRQISMSVPKLSLSLNQASDRCFQLTEGCLFPTLIHSSFEEYLSKYLERFSNLMQRLGSTQIV